MKRVARELTTSDTEDGWMVRLNGVPFSGEVVDVEDGQVVMLTTYEDGIEHGPQWEIYPDGTKRCEGTFNHGDTVGEWLNWFSDGRLQS